MLLHEGETHPKIHPPQKTQFVQTKISRKQAAMSLRKLFVQTVSIWADGFLGGSPSLDKVLAIVSQKTCVLVYMYYCRNIARYPCWC